MPSPSTQDEQATHQPKPKTAAGLFESSPAHGAALEDTRPFSLLNALLADVPDAVRYRAPSFQPLPEPEIDVEPTAGQLAAALLKNAGPSAPKAKAEPKQQESKAAILGPECEPQVQVVDGIGQEVAREKEFPESEDATKPKSKLKVPSSWPQRGFLSRVARSKASKDPLDKAIRIFESLSDSESERVEAKEEAPVGEAPELPGEVIAADSPDVDASEDPSPVPEKAISDQECESFVDEHQVSEAEAPPEAEQVPDLTSDDEATTRIETRPQLEPVAEDGAVQFRNLDDWISEKPTAPIEERSGIVPSPQAVPASSPFTQVAPAGEPIAKDAIPFHRWPTSEGSEVSVPNVGTDNLSSADALTEKVEIDPADQPTAPINLKPTPLGGPAIKPQVPPGGLSKPAIMDDEAVTQPFQLRGPSAPPPRPAAPPPRPAAPPSPPAAPSKPVSSVSTPAPPQAQACPPVQEGSVSPLAPPQSQESPLLQDVPNTGISSQDEPASAWSLNAARVFLNNSEVRQESVNDKVASLLDILERVLPESEGGSLGATPNESKQAKEATSPLGNESQSSEASGTFVVPLAPKPKIKLVPRTTENQGDFDITAPVTVVSPSTPVSPFTKVAAGSTKDVRPAALPAQSVAQRPKAPQADPSAEANGPGVPSFAQQLDRSGPAPYPVAPPTPRPSPTPPAEMTAESASPFSVVDKQANVVRTPVAQNPDFASPFSSAMKKNAAREREQVTSDFSSRPRTKPRITSLSEQVGEESAEILPTPTYSFSALDTASVRDQAPEKGPVADPTSGGDGTIRRRRRTESPSTIEQEPEKPAWGFLTILLGFICAVFLVLYIIEVYQQLRLPPGRPTPIPPDAEGVMTPGEESARAADALDRGAQLVPLAGVDLSEPLDAIKGFLNASTVEGRLPFILEDSSVAETMRRHYATFGGLDEPLPDTIALVGDSLPEAKPQYVIFRLHWKDYAPLNLRLIRQEDGSHRFSWYAFEQWRHQLLERFVVGEWSEWPHFYVQIRPGDAPPSLSEDESAKYLWYKVTSPESIGYTITACVPLDSPLAKEFTNTFQANRNYEVVLEFERLVDGQSEPLDYLLILRRLSDGWGSAH